MNRMRIAVWHNLPSGGGKRALYDQVRGLLSRDHQIEAWCPPTADQTYLPLAELIPEHVVPLTRPVARTNWEKRLRIPARMEPQLAGMDDHCRASAAAINSGGFDLLFAHPCVYFAVSAIARFVQLPSVIYLQEPFRALYEAMPRLPWLAAPDSQLSLMTVGRLREVALDHRNLRNARVQGREEIRNAAAFDRILVNSFFSRETILRSYGLDADVCYLGTDLSRFTDHASPRERLIVGLGSFSPSKNLRLAIEAVALIPSPRPMLAWIGNSVTGDHLEEMVALAKCLNVPFTAHLRIADDEIVTLMNRATAMIYAPRLEPFGYAAIEAAACGLPVVAVAEGGVRETIIDGETGLLVHNTAQAVADGVLRLLSDPEMARLLGAAARANAERRWSLNPATDRIEQALLSVARGLRQ